MACRGKELQKNSSHGLGRIGLGPLQFFFWFRDTITFELMHDVEIAFLGAKPGVEL